MMRHEIILCTGAFYYFIDPGVMKLHQCPGFSVDHVIMLPRLVCLFVLSLAAAEFMPYNQPAVDQKFNCVVECGP